MRPITPSNTRRALIFIIVAGSYFVAGKVGLDLAVVHPNITAIWMPAGVALAALLLGGYRLWPAIFVGAFLTNFLGGGIAGTFWMPFLIAIGNTTEALLAAYLTRRFADGVDAFLEPQDVFRFSFLAGFLSTAVGASIGVSVLALGGALGSASFGTAWLTWWLGDMGGVLTVAPFIILWVIQPKYIFSKERLFELVFLGVLLAIFGLLGFEGQVGFTYLFTPILVWGAFRFAQRETATAIFGLTAISVWGTLQGSGPFAQNGATLNGSFLLLEISMATDFITMMALTALVRKHRRGEYAMELSAQKMVREKFVDDAILASVGDGLVVTDVDGTISVANPQAGKMLCWERSELIGRNYYDAVPMEDEEGNLIPRKERPLYQVIHTGEKQSTIPSSPTRYYVRKDGTRFPISFTKTPIEIEGDVVGAIEVFRDVTIGKEIDRAKSDFVSLASHQLRTPLSIISMYADLLKRQDGLFEQRDDHEWREYVNEIYDATRRMADLINDLLNVSRIDTETLSVNPGIVNLRKVIDNIIREMKIKTESKGLKMKTDFPPDTPELTTDVHLIGMVLQNLISNAVKYTPEKGTITISMKTKGKYVIIDIADTGYGIPEAQQGEIFKKMFRADNIRRIDGEGTGLGLYIVRSVLEKLGGSISFTSQEGKGTTFTVQLPIKSV